MKDNQHPKLMVMRYTVRGIELDATGKVSPGWIARLLEDTRWRAFAADDYALRGVMEGGVARAGTYQYIEPLRYGDSIEIATWVARVGRTSFDFGHRIARVDGGRVVARARMTVVNLGPNGPAPVDARVSSFLIHEPAPPSHRWPEGDRSDSWTREWTVRPSDQDSFGHVNQAKYVDFIDDTRWFARKAGAPAGLEGTLRELSVEYVRETHAGQDVRMETWVTGPDSRAFELTGRKSGQVLARGQALRA